MNNDSITAFIPRPIQIVIDDVGWRNGIDGSASGQPYRSGAERLHNACDYEALAELGRALNIRPQAAMILSEWDCKNELASIPSTSWMGSNWDNSKNIGPWMQEAAKILQDNAQHIEITLHGLGHEYWDGATFTRAEWADRNGNMRSIEDIEQRLRVFHSIMDFHDLGPKPESFVPCAFCHGFGRETQGIHFYLNQAGIRYLSTPFEIMRRFKETQAAQLGIEENIIVIDRGHYQVPWNAFDAIDESLEIPGPILGLHWTNVLHQDPSKNHLVVDRWIKHLKAVNQRKDVFLAKDTQEAWTQFFYHSFYEVNQKNGQLYLKEKIGSTPIAPSFLGNTVRIYITNNTDDWDEIIIPTPQ